MIHEDKRMQNTIKSIRKTKEEKEQQLRNCMLYHLRLRKGIRVRRHSNATQFQLVFQGPRMESLAINAVPGPPPPLLERF